MLNTLTKLKHAIQQEPWARAAGVEKDFWTFLMEWIEQHVLHDFLSEITLRVDEIVDIDPDLPEPRILGIATQTMVDFLGACSASVRIYDPHTAQMLSYGSYPSDEETRETYIPLEGSIAGEVVATGKPCLVPNILSEERYRNKEVVEKRGVYSLMAIPLDIPRFYPSERDTVGVIQFYYPEKDRSFSPLEILVAELLAKRLSFVVARKKILSMQRVSTKKDTIVRHIFRSLGSRGGIKMKEVFDRVIPELADMVDLQSCALFSVAGDYNHVVLEAGYPEHEGYHSIGKRFHVSSEPAFEVLLGIREYRGDGVYEILNPSYILVVDPKRSTLISENMKRFSETHNINSILYIPLSVEGEITHFMTFDALDQRKRYREDEIEILLFLGRELMKAQRMERLDDILHDFKNPTIATAGFARRLKKLLDQGEWDRSRDQILKYVDILMDETSRLQELALSLYEVGQKQVVDMSEVLRRRFEINREAIKEQLKQNVTLEAGPFAVHLPVLCYPMHLERVFDNLLNNATKAIPLRGGKLWVRTYEDGAWACAEITNTGKISDEDRQRLLGGEGQGRGLYITYRIIRLLNGNIEVKTGKTETTFAVRLPLHREAA
ncbi:MAG: GAF domain-containing protein [Deltaproteobacteria bacterium]|nr:GAF domain-containing protein [Deltaproteobacteria bacterium]MBW1921981.1 GAF domain-containing protein [Deltaproteobacteria bacterium]MBW1948750.1 GAF domain-containing protein [Deltaproteobacteria bacterium]MBW2006428.1 GAF domain-containing protein [Deltaproteobacteria bacterium]MBW2102050.1 GAF domain-containing protein [Deltaproteobacteria bacterium]